MALRPRRKPKPPKPSNRSPQTSPPSVSAAKAVIVVDSQDDDDDSKDLKIQKARLLQARVEGMRRKFDLRGRWSSWIITWISVSLVFNFVLICLVGAEVFNFGEWFATIVIIELFLQVVGLGYVAANFLFSDGQGD